MIRSSVIAACALAVLSGCGGGSGGGDSPSEAGGDLPKCSDVWQVGKKLDQTTYEGCDTDPVYTSSGCYDADSNYRGQFMTYADRLWVIQTNTDSKTGDGGVAGTITDVDPNC